MNHVEELLQEYSVPTRKSMSQLGNLPVEATASGRVDLYLKQIGGPLNLIPGSAAQQMYHAVTFWETGLMLARKSLGNEAINLLFRGLLTQRRGCTQVIIPSGDPNNPDGSFRWFGMAIGALNQQMTRVGYKATESQKKYMELVMGFKLSVVKSYYLDSFKEPGAGLEEVRKALEILAEAKRLYTPDTVPQEPKGMVLWLEGESFFNDSMIARVKNLEGDLLTLMAQRTNEASYNREAVTAFDMVLTLDPTYALGWIGKANNLCRSLEEIKQSFACYQHAIDLFPDDDTDKAVACYQTAFGTLIGMLPSSRNVGMLKQMIKRAEEYEDKSYPLFGQAPAEGKSFCESFLKQLNEYKDEDTFPTVDPFTNPITNREASERCDEEMRKRKTCFTCSTEYSNLLQCETCKKLIYCSTECKESGGPEHKELCQAC